MSMKRLTLLCAVLLTVTGINLYVQWGRYVDGQANRGRFYGIVASTEGPEGYRMSYCVVLSKTQTEAEWLISSGSCKELHWRVLR